MQSMRRNKNCTQNFFFFTIVPKVLNQISTSNDDDRYISNRIHLLNITQIFCLTYTNHAKKWNIVGYSMRYNV